MLIFLLTGLFEASLDPLREPAQVTVTVQGVGTKSPKHTIKKYNNSCIKDTYIQKQIPGAALTGGTER